MQMYYDEYHQPEKAKVYLGTPYNQILCALNGIEEDTFTITPKLNNTYDISFEVNRYINIFGKQVESNAYNLLDILMRVYVTDIGWFRLDSPTISNDGNKETKSVTGQSIDIELNQHDIEDLKINRGTTDSYEMLVEGNVEEIDGVEFAKEQIKFYSEQNTELSFLHILLKVTGLYGWSIGYVDTTPKTYKYYEDGELKERSTSLPDEIGTFEISHQDLYSFLTQDAAQFYNCIFVFDIKNLTINAYRPETLGKDTNINIGFRNIQQSNEVSIDDSNLFTRYSVAGADDLGITYVNFGSNIIENIEEFLNEKYLPASTIMKYKLWQNDVEVQRPLYIEQTRLYNAQLDVIAELRNRVPLDGCSTDWSTFTDEELLEAQANYQAQLKGYEQFYVDEDGNFDEEALAASSDANDYYQIRDVILPSIQIEIDNRNLPTDEDKEDYIDSYKTDWKLYGLDELEVKLQDYKNRKTVLETGGYDGDYDSTLHNQDMYNKLHQEYLDILNQLDPDFVGSCQEAYNIRKQEVDDATEVLNQYDETRKSIMESVAKETWKNDDISFSETDLANLSKLYIDNTYTNQNMFLTSSDDAVSAIDEQLKLLSAAQDDLYIASHKQYTYTTTLDNFLAKYEYRNYTANLNLGDFIYLGVRDDYVVKLRVISYTYNPMVMDNSLEITFSNMIRSRSSRDDVSYLLGLSSNRGRSSASGSSNDYLSNEGIALSAGLIQKLVQSGAFSDKVGQMIDNEFAGYIGNIIVRNPDGSVSMTVDELNAQMIKVVDIVGENGFFEYLQSKLISADRIVADSAEFGELSAKLAEIDNLLAGNVGGEVGQFIHLTAQNVQIDEAVIKDIIAAQLLVSDLQAGDITLSDAMRIISENGSMVMNGTTLQIKGTTSTGEEYVAIQLGYDTNNNPSLIIRDENGAVMLDGSGLHEDIVPDGLIKNDMVADGTLSKDKLNFQIVETDENGKVNATEILLNGQGLDAAWTSMQEQIENIDSYGLAIILGNETYIFPGDSTGHALPDSVTTQVIAYKNTSQVPTHVEEITNLPTGISAVINDNDTINTSITFSASTALTSSGSVNIPITADGKTFTKVFNYILSIPEEGEPAKTVSITASSQVFKSDDWGKTFSPDIIKLTPLFQGNIEYSKWQYSLNSGSSWVDVVTGTHGLVIEATVLSISKDTDLFTDDITSITFKCLSNEEIYYDTFTVFKLYYSLVGVEDDIAEVVKTEISGVETRVDAVEKSIKDEVWRTTMITVNDEDGNPTQQSIEDLLVSHTTDLNGISMEVKDVQTTIKDIGNVGARNLIRNSKTMIFEDYGFIGGGGGTTTGYLTDENGNRLTDENNNRLTIN